MARVGALLVLAGGCSFSAGGVTGDGAAADSPVARDAQPDTRGTTCLEDAPVGTDLVVQAEAYTSIAAGSGTEWALQTDPAGYDACGFMRLIPPNGASCMDLGAEPGCAASLSFAVTVSAGGTYFFHARTIATSPDDDSLWYGVDGSPVLDVLVPPSDGVWHWSTGDAQFPLMAGPHTIDVWQREAGLRLDVVALTESATPPSP